VDTEYAAVLGCFGQLRVATLKGKETMKVFGFPGSGGVKLLYSTLKSMPCGAEEKHFRENEGGMFPCPWNSENPVILSQSPERGNEQ